MFFQECFSKQTAQNGKDKNPGNHKDNAPHRHDRHYPIGVFLTETGGKQKEWEEHYNAKRKAQVEAAKATIRAEDMEKGIFTTVSQLPRQEPRKATVSASATV